MTILFVNLGSKTKSIPTMLKRLACKVISTLAAEQALQLIRENSFDAVVLQEAEAEPDTINFTLDAYRTRPDVPVFLMNDWGTDLVPALRSLCTFSR